MDWIQVPRMDRGLLSAGAEPSISIHLDIKVVSSHAGLTMAREASSWSCRRYKFSAFLLWTTIFFEGRVLASETGARVWKVPLPDSAFLCMLTLSSRGVEPPELLEYAEDSIVYTTGAIFDLPCLVN